MSFDPDAKAVELLERWLTPLQLDKFRNYHYIDVIGSHTKKRYRIDCKSYTSNILTIDDKGKVTHVYCVIPRSLLPHGDALLAQKVALETDEKRVLKIIGEGDLPTEIVLIIRFVLAGIIGGFIAWLISP